MLVVNTNYSFFAVCTDQLFYDKMSAHAYIKNILLTFLIISTGNRFEQLFSNEEITLGDGKTVIFKHNKHQRKLQTNLRKIHKAGYRYNNFCKKLKCSLV